MAPIVAKLRRLGAARKDAVGADRRRRRDLRHDWLYWSCIGAGIVLLIALYFWVTSARLLQDPIELDYGPLDPGFTATLGPVVGAEFTRGNSVRTLVNGDRFFPAMLAAIRGAEHTITLETYIWEPGRISDEFIAALEDRARHGVKVDILVDGMGTLFFHGKGRELLERAGIRILTYGREHWYEVKPNINHRTHRKLLIIDGRIGFTGGMCIADKWAGNADSPNVWRDTVVELRGPVVREMQAAFASNWLHTTSTLLTGNGFFPPARSVGTSLAQCFMSGPGEEPQYARLGYLFAIASARKSIDIEQAYFVPDDLAIRMLVAARHRGVRVRIIVPEFSDTAFGRAASESRWGELLSSGVQFFEYGRAMFHCKTMVVDDALVTAGSANFDNRSFSINDEVVANILDPKVAAEHERIFRDDLAHSRRIDPGQFVRRSWWVKAVDDFCGVFRSQF